MKYKYESGFKKGSFTVDDLKNIFDFQLDFKPGRINFEKISKKNISVDFLLDLLRKENSIRFDSVKPGDGSFFYWKNKNEYLEWHSNGEKPDSSYLDSLILRPGFYFAYCYDAHFVDFQNETKLNNYKAYNKPYNHLKIFRDIDGEELVDISVNPGRSFFNQNAGINVMAAWKMWFSKEVRSLFPGKKPEEFNSAYEIKMLPNDVLFIQLYRDVEKSDSAEALAVMQEFRDWVNLSMLEEQTVYHKTFNSEKNEDILNQITFINKEFRNRKQ